MKPKLIAITPGEPAGIGPDIALKLMQHTLPCPVVIVADRQLLRERARSLGLEITLPDYDPKCESRPPVSLLPLPLQKASQPGILDTDNASYVIETIRRATTGCLNGEFDALVTAPIHKANINAAGTPFTGHTEFLAELTGAKQPVMLLANEQLKVALATTHIPLKDVANTLSEKQLRRCLDVLHFDLKTKWGINHPRILVCGLNPHAGEGGYLGNEENTLIRPMIQSYQAQGMDVRGPCPADTAFTPAQREKTDAVLALYHDQGLPAIKALGFGETINVTLGLPIIRTSVDHGTALELAGTGGASEKSLLAAVDLAHTLAQKAHSHNNAEITSS